MRMEPSKLLDVASQTLIDCINAVKAGGQWIAGQIPDVLHQLIMWTVWTGVLWTVLLLSSIFFTYMFAFKWSNQEVKVDAYGDRSWSGTKIASCVIGGIITMLITIGFSQYIADALQALIAPKLFLLEYAADIYKNSR